MRPARRHPFTPGLGLGLCICGDTRDAPAHGYEPPPIDLPIPPPSTPDPMSKAAAASVQTVAGTLRRRVADYIGSYGPVAEWRIEEALHLEGNTVRPRIWELRKAKLVEARGKGSTPSGRACHLYVLTPAGREVISEA